ncbi:MAG: hypothetical protein AAF702_11325 [Chloroflexota bacterium]
MGEPTENSILLTGRYLLAYLAWVLLTIVGFWLIFRLHENLLGILTFFLEDPNTMRDTWITRAIERWFIMLMGGLWVFCIVLLEGYFRHSIPQNLLLNRLRRTVIIVAIITAISFGLQMILYRLISF